MKTIIAVVITALITAAGATAVTTALITSAQIKNGTIRMIDLHPSTRTALKGQRGPQGARGPQGSQGPQGPAGNNGGFDPSKVQSVTGPVSSVPPEGVVTVQAVCPAGTRVISGGHAVSIARASASTSFGGPSTWSVIVYNDTSLSVDANAYALCAAP